MEREQIIKALELHSQGAVSCLHECPYGALHNCGSAMARDVLYLIKELTEENEILKKTIDRIGKNNDEIARVYPLAIKEAKADTVRKMQKRLKAKAYTNNYCQDVVLLSNIDQIAKEMINNGEKEN